jgi:hypothetical protein
MLEDETVQNLYTQSQVRELVKQNLLNHGVDSAKIKKGLFFPKTMFKLKKINNLLGIEFVSKKQQLLLMIDGLENGKMEKGFLGLNNSKDKITIDFNLSGEKILFLFEDGSENQNQFITIEEYYDAVSILWEVINLKEKYLYRNKSEIE